MAYTEKMSSDERIRRALCCRWNVSPWHISLYCCETTFYDWGYDERFEAFCRCVRFHGVLTREDKARIFDLVYLGAWDIAYWLGEEHVDDGGEDEFLFVNENYTVH